MIEADDDDDRDTRRETREKDTGLVGCALDENSLDRGEMRRFSQ
jgi:hypothetical protein